MTQDAQDAQDTPLERPAVRVIEITDDINADWIRYRVEGPTVGEEEMRLCDEALAEYQRREARGERIRELRKRRKRTTARSFKPRRSGRNRQQR